MFMWFGFALLHSVAESHRVEILGDQGSVIALVRHDPDLANAPFNLSDSRSIQEKVQTPQFEKDLVQKGSVLLHQNTDLDIQVDKPKNAEKSKKTDTTPVAKQVTKPATKPGQNPVAPCLSEAWKEFLSIESTKCWDAEMARGAQRQSELKCQQGRFLTLDMHQSGRYLNLDCPLSPGPDADQLLASLQDSDWDGNSDEPFPLPFNILLLKFPNKAQAWETNYLSSKWPQAAKAIKPNLMAHWYELELNPGGIHPNANPHQSRWFEEDDDALKIPELGRLFGTRLPRKLGDVLQDVTKYRQVSSDAISFKAHLDLIGGDFLVVPLIIDKDIRDKAGQLGLEGHHEVDLPEAASQVLHDYYKSLGLTTLQCPFNDFGIPHIHAMTECVERIAIHLANGGNVVIHCFGGTGRTGTMLMSVAKTLGVPDVLGWGTRIGGPGKGCWVETHEQQLFVDQLPRIETEHMHNNIDSGIMDKISARFAKMQASPPVWMNHVNVATCHDGRTIVMQDRCQHYRSCRTCWGKPAPVSDPIPMTPTAQAHYDYVAAETVPYFAPRCFLPDGTLC